MSKINEIFPQKFTLVVNSGEGYKYTNGRTTGFSVKTVADNKVIAETTEVLDYKKGQYLQNDYGGIREYNSRGDLVSAEYNVAQYDDFVGSDYMETEGFVLLDKDLNVVYKSNQDDYTRARLMVDKNAMLKLIFRYGPCALAHIHPSAMKDEEFKKLIGSVLDRRAAKLSETNPEQIKEEVAQVKEVLKNFEQQNERKAETGFYSRIL